MGVTPVMELMIAARKAIPQLQLEHGIAVDRVYTGSFMTSLDMSGWFLKKKLCSIFLKNKVPHLFIFV